jgi:dipeptidyl aminopeptidase/acylaminoacyl peptidase
MSNQTNQYENIKPFLGNISEQEVISSNPPLQSKQQKRPNSKNSKLIIFSLIFLVLFTALPLQLLKTRKTDSEIIAPGNVNVEKTINPTSSPFPFQELTIPYLRNREYKSSLNELTLISQNSSYKNYLTSYDSDGLKINGLLTIPTGDAQENIGEAGWPAIVFVHGYIPPTTYQTTQNYASYVDYLARNGFVVFKIDLRGHADSEGEPGGAYYSGDYVIDTLNAYEALKTANFVNQKQVGLWGHSMAGNIVFRSFVAKQDIPAIVIWAGAVYTYEDMQEFGINDNSYRPPSLSTKRQRDRQRLRETEGDYSPDSLFWQQVVPTNFIDGISGAIQINHAADDSVVNIGYSRNLISILDTTQIIHQLNEYPSGEHNITGISFDKAMQNTVEFFKTYLR